MKSERCFSKCERIVSQKCIDELFARDGSQVKAAFPLRAVFMVRERSGDEPSAQVLISVPKRHLRHAVDRNGVKRQIREAYRLNKQVLLAGVPEGMVVYVAFVWLADKRISSSGVEGRMRTLLGRMARQLSPAAPSDSGSEKEMVV